MESFGTRLKTNKKISFEMIGATQVSQDRAKYLTKMYVSCADYCVSG